MTLPETNPPPLATPVIGYAGADAVQLDLRALARIRLGVRFLIAYMASAPIHLIFRNLLSLADAVYSVTFVFCLSAAACLLAANTRLPSDRAAVRRLLVAAAIALAIAGTLFATAMHFARSALTANSPYIQAYTILSPFNITAYGLALCLCFLRLADLARRFHARAIAMQALVVSVMFVAFYAIYLGYGILAAYLSINSFRFLIQILALLRCALCLWAVILLAFLLPRLKPTPS